jgi:hypothetical protein
MGSLRSLRHRIAEEPKDEILTPKGPDPLDTPNFSTSGYGAGNWFEAPVVYVPYLPLFVTNATDEESVSISYDAGEVDITSAADTTGGLGFGAI